MSAIDFQALWEREKALAKERRKKRSQKRGKNGRTKHGGGEGQLKGRDGDPTKNSLSGVKKQANEEGKKSVLNERTTESQSPKNSSHSNTKELLDHLRKTFASSISSSSFPTTRALCEGGKGWEKHCVSEFGVWYLPEVVSVEAEAVLLDHIYSAPPSRWVKLRRRRLQVWGGYPKEDGFEKEALPPWLSELCVFLKDLGVYRGRKAQGEQQGAGNEEKGEKDRGDGGGGGGGEGGGGKENRDDEQLQSFNPNHVLINEYLPGQGIMPHQDGPKYRPFVAILSLGSHTVFHFYKTLADSRSDGKTNTGALELLLQPRSLLVFSQSAYKRLFHGIAERDTDLISTGTISAEKAVDAAAAGGGGGGATDLNDKSDEISIKSAVPNQDAAYRRRSVVMKRGKRLSLTIREVVR